MPAQHVDTGELLMQAFADRKAVSETLQTGCAAAALFGRALLQTHESLCYSVSGCFKAVLNTKYGGSTLHHPLLSRS